MNEKEKRERVRARARFVADQIDGATDQLTRGAQLAQELLGYHGTSGGDPGSRRFVGELLVRMQAVGMPKCEHVTFDSPQPWVIVPWIEPLMARCVECSREAGLAVFEADDYEKWRCDVCGEVKVGNCRDRALHLANILIPIGTCSDCETRYGWPVP